MSHQGQRTKKRVGPHDLHGETASVLRRANKLPSTTGTKFTLQHLQDRKNVGLRGETENLVTCWEPSENPSLGTRKLRRESATVLGRAVAWAKGSGVPLLCTATQPLASSP